MRDNLTEKDFEYSRNITSLMKGMPDYLSRFIEWVEDSGLNFAQQVEIARDMKALVETICKEKSYVSCKDVTIDEFYRSDFDAKLIIKYVETPVKKTVKKPVWQGLR